MRVERSGNLSTGRGFLVAGILDCGGPGVLANLVMVPSPGVSGGEESGMKANGLLVAAGAESTSSKRQRRPSVRLGEPSDHPASNILQNPPKRRRVQEEEEEGDEEEEEREKEEEKGEQEQEREEEEEREKEEEKEREEAELEQDEEQARKMEWEGVPDQEREERARGRDGYHDVPVHGDFPFSGKVMHAKPRTRTLEHVASTASQSQRQRDAAILAAGSGEPGLSFKESDGEGPGPGAAVEQQQADGDQASEQGLALALVVAAEKPVMGRRQQVSNGPAKRGKATRRGGRRGGSSASYRSIGGMLQTSKKGQEEKVSKAGRQGRAGKAGKEKEGKQGKEGREGREGKEGKEDKDSKASETESVKKPSVEERQGALPLPLALPLTLLPPPPVPLAILPPPAASDKERESSDRGPLSSDATQSSFNEQGNGEEAAPNGGQQQQHGELQQEKMKMPLPLPLATRSPAYPPPETNGGRDGRVKSTDAVTAVRQEGPRAEQPDLTVGELSIKYLHRAAGAYTSGVRPWLSALGLGHHAEVFEQNEVDDEVLPLLTMEDLTEMRIPIGPKRKMFNAIQVLRDSVL